MVTGPIGPATAAAQAREAAGGGAGESGGTVVETAGVPVLAGSKRVITVKRRTGSGAGAGN